VHPRQQQYFSSETFNAIVAAANLKQVILIHQSRYNDRQRHGAQVHAAASPRLPLHRAAVQLFTTEIQ
jgi:hypothetical protein